MLESIRRNRLALKGPITTPVGTGFRSVNVALRTELDLFAAVRPARSLPGIATRHPGVDIVTVRENTEDVYRGVEFERDSEELDHLRDRLRDFARSYPGRIEMAGNVQVVEGGEVVKNDIHILERMLKVFHAAGLDRRHVRLHLGDE